MENSELFSLIIGRYRLFGVFLSADIQLTEDDVYKKSCKTFDYRACPAYFEANVANQRDVGLHDARPSIRHSDLLRTTVACTFTKTTERPAGIFRLQQETGVARNSAFFTLSRKSEVGKDLRWFSQNTFADNDSVPIISRSNAMRPESGLEYNSPYDTEMLQESFVPVAQFVPFTDATRAIFPKGQGEPAECNDSIFAEGYRVASFLLAD